MNQQRQQRRPHHNPRRTISDCPQNPVNNRVKHSRIIDDAEIQNRKDEHSCDRRNILNAFDHKAARFQTKAANQGSDNWHYNQRHQRRHFFADDRREQNDDGE